MTQEEDLLLNVLCAMLPYKPMVNEDDGLSLNGNGNDYTLLGINANKRIVLLGFDFEDAYATHKEYLENIKPYLRPIESMTEEERHEIQEILGKGIEIHDDFIKIVDSDINTLSYLEIQALFNWLNSHHLDYNRLIPKGLALEAKEGMYKNEE